MKHVSTSAEFSRWQSSAPANARQFWLTKWAGWLRSFNPWRYRFSIKSPSFFDWDSIDEAAAIYTKPAFSPSYPNIGNLFWFRPCAANEDLPLLRHSLDLSHKMGRESSEICIRSRVVNTATNMKILLLVSVHFWLNFPFIKKSINGTFILIHWESWDWSLTHYTMARKCLLCVCCSIPSAVDLRSISQAVCRLCGHRCQASVPHCGPTHHILRLQLSQCRGQWDSQWLSEQLCLLPPSHILTTN